MTESGRRAAHEAMRARGYGVQEDKKERKFYLMELSTNHRLPQKFDTEEEAINYFTVHVGGE